MTARGVIDVLRRHGAHLEINAAGKLELVGRVPDDVFELTRDRAGDLKALLREMSAGSASDAVIAAARLLRDGKWGYSPMSCDFHVGRAREDCRRCGAGFASHARTGRGR